MFSPLLAVIISKSDMKKIGWKPNIKKNIRWIMCAWFIPLVLGVMGAALYFLLFPSAWDTSFLYMRSTLGTDGISQLENSGISVPLYAGISVIAAITYAPLVNMFFAVGEEAGWRGTMYPILKEHFGITKGRLIGGAVWGVWHWPIMLLAGYEYGTSYFGMPVTGPLMIGVISGLPLMLTAFIISIREKNTIMKVR